MTKDNIATRYSDNKETSPQRDNDKGKYFVSENSWSDKHRSLCYCHWLSLLDIISITRDDWQWEIQINKDNWFTVS